MAFEAYICWPCRQTASGNFTWKNSRIRASQPIAARLVSLHVLNSGGGWSLGFRRSAGACQRDTANKYAFLSEMKSELEEDLIDFFEQHVAETFPRKSCEHPPTFTPIR